MTFLDRHELRLALRRALRPTVDPHYNRNHWPQWLYDRMTTLAIYSVSNKANCKPILMKCLRLYADGQDYSSIGYSLRISADYARHCITNGLDWIIDNTPERLLINIPAHFTVWRLKGCQHCGGDLQYDRTEGFFNCLQCARQFTIMNDPIRKEKEPGPSIEGQPRPGGREPAIGGGNTAGQASKHEINPICNALQ